MAINKNKIVALAQKYTAKGQFEKAIAEYQKVLGAEPTDIRTWLKIGDLYTRMGARKEATDTYLKVAEQYTKGGFHLKAVAVYKQVLKLDPTLIEIHQYLADSYLELGLTSEALIQLEQLADMYQRTGRMESLLGVLMRMGEIDPHNIATRLRIAEYLSKENRVAEAVEHFSIACEELKKQGRLEDFLKVAERLLYHDSTRVELAREVAGVYLERAQYKHALAKLQACFVKDPRDLDTLEMLAHAFRGLGQPDKAISVYKEITVLLSDPGQAERRNYFYHAILAIDSSNEFAKQGLGYTHSQAAAAAAGASPESDAYSNSSMPEESEMVSAVAALSDLESSDAPHVGRDAQDILENELEEFEEMEELTDEDVAQKIQEIISETDVLLKYGLTDRALDHIQRVFDFDPYNIDARERMKDILLECGRVSEALDQLFTLADVFRDSQPEGAVYYLHEVLRINSDNERAREMILELGGIMPEDMLNQAPDAEGEPEVYTIPEDAGDIEVFDEEMLELMDDKEDGFQVLDLDPLDADEEEMMEVPEDDSLVEVAGEGTDIEDLVLDAPGLDYDEFEEETTSLSKSVPFEPELRFPVQEQASGHKPVSEERFDEESEDEIGLVEEDETDYPGETVGKISSIPSVSDEDPLERALETVRHISSIPPTYDEKPLETAGEISSIPPTFDDELAVSQEIANQLDALSRVNEKLQEEETKGRAKASMTAPVSQMEESSKENLPEIDDELEEIDFFISQGLIDEAEIIAEDLMSLYPDDPRVQQAVEKLKMSRLAEESSRLSEESSRLSEEPPRLSEEPPRLSEEPRRLSEEPRRLSEEPPRLSEEPRRLSEEPPRPSENTPPLPEVEKDAPFLEDLDFEFEPLDLSAGGILGSRELSQSITVMKVDVQNEIAESDYATHYDLGIAYKEMGLFEDAVNEFTISSRDPRKQALSKLMIGMCFKDLDRKAEAVQMFLMGLKTPNLKVQEKHGLLYELGVTYQDIGKQKEALKCFRMIHSVDPKFADVASRLANLSGSSIPAPRRGLFG